MFPHCSTLSDFSFLPKSTLLFFLFFFFSPLFSRYSFIKLHLIRILLFFFSLSFVDEDATLLLTNEGGWGRLT